MNWRCSADRRAPYLALWQRAGGGGEWGREFCSNTQSKEKDESARDHSDIY